MPATWPSQLQEYLNEGAFDFSYGKRVLVSEMDIGPSKRRLLYTRAVNKFTCSINITTQEFIDYWNPFYEVTLAAGVNEFSFLHPLKQEMKNFKIDGEPQITPLGGGNFTVRMVWEEQP